MKLLVTGREGQLVRSLVERAAASSHVKMITAGRPEVDLAVPGAIRAAILANRPDLVINAAAYTLVDQAEDEPALAHRVNAEAAGEAAAAAAEVGAPTVQISTDYVFDGAATQAIAEDRPTDPINRYGATKLAGEEAVRAGNPRHVILRTAWVISPFGRNFVTAMLGAASTRSELTVVADQRGSPTSALDLADAIFRLAMLIAEGREGLLGRTFHLAGSGDASWCELAQAIMDEAAAHGLPHAAIRPIPSTDWPTRARRPAYSVLDSRICAAATGFVMPDWRTSVATIVRRLARSA
ncbi:MULTISPECIES: dTDP-4-dehydrorhamnose reductase [Sphingomonas]|uniref:dTDP-4-dehydrorhamnose reductase n=1 Tax=Sphingomonas TaxID=13687 RepID=UPI000DEF424B|nr:MULTISPECIES: dTDP-4-dehydrorhamnose reductase [Sphingomonas]